MEPAGTEVPIQWRGRRTKAFVPQRLAERNLDLDAVTASATARAQSEVEHAAASMPQEYAALARLLLRSEGVASSFIEGVTAPVMEIVLAEQRPGASHTPAGWVAANLAALTEALESASSMPLTVITMCAWHRTLMAGSPTPAQYVGVLRTEQGWIGGSSPLDAHLVTPPHTYLPDLLDDLVAYANRKDVDPIAQAALCHAQFEVIHPFADGNGRVGRILIAWIFVRRLSLYTAPPVSTRLAADVGAYAAGLTMFRLGQHEQWVRWFAEAVSGAGRAQQDLVASIEVLRSAWKQRLGAARGSKRRLRENSAAWEVLDLIPRHVVLTAPLLVRELGIAPKTAHAALRELVRAGVLVEYGTDESARRGRPRTLFASPELLGLAGSTPLRG